MTYRRMVSVSLVLTVLLFCLVGCKDNKASNADKTIVYGLTSDPKTLDPQMAADSTSITAIEALFEGLTRLDADGNAIPGVAKRWESNANSTEFTFYLRSDAKWSDDTPVTADDFVYALHRAVLPQTNSPSASQTFCIKNAKQIYSGQLSPENLGVTAVDEYTLKISLAYSYPDFPKLTASAIFMPCNQEFFTSTSGRYGLESAYVLENGPFCIDGKYGWVHDQYLNLKRSSNYSGEKTPLPASIKFLIDGNGFNSDDPVDALENGDIDAIPISASQVEEAKAIGCTVISFQNSTWGLSFNTSSDLMKNEKIRQAFIQAFDREKVLSYKPLDTEKADTILLPNTTFLGENYRKLVDSPSLPSQDSNAAQTLAEGLAELGLSDISSISVLCPDDENVKLMLNEMIISWNSQFHNYFNMETMDEATLQSRVSSGNYEIALFPITPDSDGPSQVLSLFSSSANGNFTNYNNAQYDTLLAKAESTGGLEAASLYAAAEDYLNQQAVFYPLYYSKRYYAMAQGVSGIVFHPYQGGVDFISAGKE